MEGGSAEIKQDCSMPGVVRRHQRLILGLIFLVGCRPRGKSYGCYTLNEMARQ